ncbi:MAG TPA: MlaD family protein, partial [Thermoleophilaceae bacterium]|nr:MlaD family protein [Thermoleophilaceae bacterium]
MVRRIATAVIVLGACAAAVVLSAASGEPKGTTYYAIFDNAFGLTEGGDLRIGGVRAGETSGFSVSEGEPVKARVELKITEPGFDSLREDARCEVRQQSLIGEYYVDCQPGTSGRELEPGDTIPVEQTASIIAADLVNNVLRQPYRERLRLIIAELGTGLAGRPEDLSAALRRAHPGLRQTIDTLDILKGQTQVLRDFVSDSDEAVDDLARNRKDVVRFVQEAGETAAISATRREELAEQFDKLPTFLAELDPTMVELGNLADAQIPLLADLRSASDELNAFFTRLGPFSDATLTSLGPLGEASLRGSEAIRAT